MTLAMKRFWEKECSRKRVLWERASAKALRAVATVIL